MTQLVNTNKMRGRAAFLESKDCTVRAIAAALRIPYAKAHEAARLAGRRMKRGFWPDRILKSMGVSFTEARMYDEKRAKCGSWRTSPYPTLSQVLPLLSKGQYILDTRNHAFAVVDGVIYDGSRLRLRQRIQSIFEIKVSTGGN